MDGSRVALTICNLILLPSSSIVRILKSVIKESEKKLKSKKEFRCVSSFGQARTDSDGSDKTRRVGIITKPEQETRLAYACLMIETVAGLMIGFQGRIQTE